MYFKNQTFTESTLRENNIFLNHCVMDNMAIIAHSGDVRITICDSSLHQVKIICENEGIINIILRNNLIQESGIYLRKDNLTLANTCVTLISNTIHGLTCEPVIPACLIQAFDNNGLTFESHKENGYEDVNHPLIKPLAYHDLKESNQLNVAAILQNPGLPTGCEITSLTIVLNYLGYAITKEDMTTYLDKAPMGKANPWYQFIGSPEDPDSYGCYTTCLEKAALAYKKAYQATFQVTSHVGLIPEELYHVIDNGYPVIVWANMGMMAPRESTVWNFNGHPFRWRANEHCLVLTGYDSQLVYMADPLRGLVTYDRILFELRYQSMYAQSLILEEK